MAEGWTQHRHASGGIYTRVLEALCGVGQGRGEGRQPGLEGKGR